MDLKAYEDWRDEALTRTQPQRFDGLDPLITMDFVRRWEPSSSTADAQDALHAWTRLHQATLHARWAPTQGVRAALSGLFEAAGQRGMELWLPEDACPAYGQAARVHAPNAPRHRFRTFPTPDFAPLSKAGPRALLVIAHPLSPTGRFLSPTEIATLAQWAAQGYDRWVVLDGMHLYGNRLPRSAFPGFGEARVLALFSPCQSWLVPDGFGTIGGPTAGDPWWHEACARPDPKACADAIQALTHDPSMPLRQRRVFQAEWSRRAWRLQAYASPQGGPGQGYLRPVHVRAEVALERDNILLVPASVFGCPDPTWSVASCLYEAKQQHQP